MINNNTDVGPSWGEEWMAADPDTRLAMFWERYHATMADPIERARLEQDADRMLDYAQALQTLQHAAACWQAAVVDTGPECAGTFVLAQKALEEAARAFVTATDALDTERSS